MATPGGLGKHPAVPTLLDWLIGCTVQQWALGAHIELLNLVKFPIMHTAPTCSCGAFAYGGLHLPILGFQCTPVRDKQLVTGTVTCAIMQMMGHGLLPREHRCYQAAIEAYIQQELWLPLEKRSPALGGKRRLGKPPPEVPLRDILDILVGELGWGAGGWGVLCLRSAQQC